MHLTGPQRNCLLSLFRAHPAPYEVRGGAALLPRRLVEDGLAVEVEAGKSIRRFQLTARGVERATRLAARREADHAAGAARMDRYAQLLSEEPGSKVAGSVGAPSLVGWPFPESAHAWPAPHRSR